MGMRDVHFEYKLLIKQYFLNFLVPQEKLKHGVIHVSRQVCFFPLYNRCTVILLFFLLIFRIMSIQILTSYITVTFLQYPHDYFKTLNGKY